MITYIGIYIAAGLIVLYIRAKQVGIMRDCHHPYDRLAIVITGIIAFAVWPLIVPVLIGYHRREKNKNAN